MYLSLKAMHITGALLLLYMHVSKHRALVEGRKAGKSQNN